MVTTGILVTYRNSFVVEVFNIQSPNKDTVP